MFGKIGTGTSKTRSQSPYSRHCHGAQQVSDELTLPSELAGSLAVTYQQKGFLLDHLLWGTEYMPITFKCSGCGKVYRIAESMAGRKGKCNVCGTSTVIPHSDQQSSPPVVPVALSARSQPQIEAPVSGPPEAVPVVVKPTQCQRQIEAPVSALPEAIPVSRVESAGAQTANSDGGLVPEKPTSPPSALPEPNRRKKQLIVAGACGGVALVVILAVMILLVTRPSFANKIVGKWEEIEGKNERMELFKNGSAFFQDEDMSLGGSWKVLDDGRLQVATTVLGFEATEVYEASISGDILTTKDTKSLSE